MSKLCSAFLTMPHIGSWTEWKAMISAPILCLRATDRIVSQKLKPMIIANAPVTRVSETILATRPVKINCLVSPLLFSIEMDMLITFLFN